MVSSYRTRLLLLAAIARGDGRHIPVTQKANRKAKSRYLCPGMLGIRARSNDWAQSIT